MRERVPDLGGESQERRRRVGPVGGGRAASPGGVRACVFCGRRTSSRARFCGRCGSRMSTTWSPPPPPPPAPRDSTPLVLAVGLIAVLVLGLIGVAWALHDPWGGAAAGEDERTAASQASAWAVHSSRALLSPPTPSQPRPSAPTRAKRQTPSFGRSTFPEYGVTLCYPRGWRELAASLVSDGVPYWSERLSQDQDLLAAYLLPSGEGAVIAFADHYAEPELSRFEFRLDGELVLRELAGIGLPEMRLHGENVAGRHALVSDTVTTPNMAMAAVVIVGKDRLYYFAFTARDKVVLSEVRRGYWPALQRTEFTSVRPG